MNTIVDRWIEIQSQREKLLLEIADLRLCIVNNPEKRRDLLLKITVKVLKANEFLEELNSLKLPE